MDASPRYAADQCPLAPGKSQAFPRRKALTNIVGQSATSLLRSRCRLLHRTGHSRHIPTTRHEAGIRSVHEHSDATAESSALLVAHTDLARHWPVQRDAVRARDACGKNALLVDSTFLHTAILLAGVGSSDSACAAARPPVSADAIPAIHVDRARCRLRDDRTGIGSLGGVARRTAEPDAEVPCPVRSGLCGSIRSTTNCYCICPFTPRFSLSVTSWSHGSA